MIPSQYADLETIADQPMLRQALLLYGTTEKAGDADNPVILAWAKEIGGQVAAIYNHDAMPWCGLFMGVVAKRAQVPFPALCIRALDWRDFGTIVTEPALGDVLVFVRTGGGHVGIYVGEDDKCFHVLGGNQGDMVQIARVARECFRAARRPLYVSTPASVRKISRGRDGDLFSGRAMV